MPVIEEEPVTKETPTTTYDRTRYETRPERGPGGPGPLKLMAGGAVIEAVMGLAAVILAIIGLSGTYVLWMASLATIVVGLAFLVGGGTFATQAMGVGAEGRTTRPRFGDLHGGLLAIFIGGLAGIILGILAILEVIPSVLLPLAAVILGITLVLSSGPSVRFGRQMMEAGTGSTSSPGFLREAVWLAVGVVGTVGLGSLVLGIIGLADIYPVTLSLVAMLTLGLSIFAIGTALSDRLVRSLDRGTQAM